MFDQHVENQKHGLMRLSELLILSFLCFSLFYVSLSLFWQKKDGLVRLSELRAHSVTMLVREYGDSSGTDSLNPYLFKVNSEMVPQWKNNNNGTTITG